VREAKRISEIHPAKEPNGPENMEMFSAGSLYPVNNDNPKNNAPIKTDPPAANASSLPFDFLSMTGNELGVSGLTQKIMEQDKHKLQRRQTESVKKLLFKKTDSA
jgi:hypothetical protein